MYSGILNLAIFSARKDERSDSVNSAPGFKEMRVASFSPKRSSGTPNTEASLTDGCSYMAASISRHAMFSPPLPSDLLPWILGVI